MRREKLGLVGIVSVAALTAACSSGGGGGGTGGPGGSAKEPAAPVVTITPADGTGKAKPEQGISVKTDIGALQSVKVQLKGKDVPGAMNADKTSWKSAWTLQPNASYTVEAVAAGEQGKTTTATSSFKTLKPASTLGLEYNIPSGGDTVGVGMPVVLNFDQPVVDKKAVEKSLVVESKYANEGAWYWYTDKQVIFRTKKYWKAYQTIKVTGHLAGVKAAKNVYGASDFTLKFKIGSQSISTVNTKTHRMVVKVDGKKKWDVGISAGKATERKYTTTSGIHLTMDKKNPETMISPGIKEGEPGYYKEIVPYAVRISYSGEYVHSAPWSVGSQGRANVSHGCVNAPPSFAREYYGTSKWGDIVDIKGTTRELEFDNGYGWWQKPWKQWILGSAFDKPVSTAPQGDPTTAPDATTPATGTPTTPGTTTPTTPAESPVA
ncbi:L,D-transpeptidase [Actinocorallia longicatena]|uniref:Ig-like domain-containing protein n=1 Tax=Actinocorallia longicatena TaxID=111803 RepID=A0ABP6Q6R3_9ACTN